MSAGQAENPVTHPAYGVLRPVTSTASVLLCNNPNIMTLDGTNTWVLRGPGSDEMVIVDPGPDDDEHIGRLAELGKIPLVLISHKHEDHTGGIDKIVAFTGAVVRSVGSGFLRGLGGPLTDGEVIDAAGLRITVMATPGHTADSLSFLVDGVSDGEGAVLTADTVLGRGTTVIDDEDGSLSEYLDSLRRLHGLGRRTVLPGHGPDLDDLEAVTAMYLAHREERLDQVRQALRVLGDDATARQVVEHVYTDVDQELWDAAEKSVRAQLDYLRS
ncbi:MBL fold metallo-hydrolase [Mycolicibacterium helvum]|uniref:MBL fold metallo-hydrolase n=1 Tax=Mycolicibacterium helvum TaxID=1534349 RepID=A0A7I7T8F3_9MYCO|nr:MBL fold metallo-hydrolase [Mycolicibacterium helvum]